MNESADAEAKRSRWLVPSAMLAAVLLVALGWWLASSFQSPAQQEANAKPPSSAPVTAVVERGVLAKQVTFSGEVGPSSRSAITFQPAAGSSVSVVTGRALTAGSTLLSGAVTTEVNGRPVLAVFSPFSFYRDMGFGDEGPDVTQLQTLLAGLGYHVSADGKFGGETASAVTGWYRKNGYAAPKRPRMPVASDAQTGGDGKNSASHPSSSSPGASDSADPERYAYVPLAEIVAVPSSTAQVLQGIEVGTHVGTSGRADLIIGSTDEIVTVSVTASELGDVAKGDAAKISLPGAEVDGIVGDITTASGATDAVEAPGSSTAEGAQADTGQNSPSGASGQDQPAKLTFVVAPKTPLPAGTSAGAVRVVVTKRIIAQQALLVPVLAVSDRGGEKKVVTKRRNDGTSVEVPVSVLGTLQGQVAIEPLAKDALKRGDEVRVG